MSKKHISLKGEAMRAYVWMFIVSLCYAQTYCQDNTDLIIFSYDRPMQLYALLESVEHYVTGIANVTVIYRTSTPDFSKGYAQVQQNFNKVTYLQQGSDPRSDFKKLTFAATFDNPSEYVLYAVDDDIVTDYIDLNRCIELMNTYKAYAFYLRLGLNLSECYALGAPQGIPPVVQADLGVYAWRFREGMHDWAYPHNVDLTLYRKSDIFFFLETQEYHSPNSLEGMWANEGRAIMYKHGLCYECTKMVNLPLNRVQNDCQNTHMNFMDPQGLLELFNNGQKIDIRPLHQIKNISAHMNYEPTFVQR